ncbi:MAG: penicillin-binding protein activator [Desulfuromonadales bacterium]|nr:penicillin-binding protein activator [Desulfuromonadales bacterium]MDW7756078.1 penicillin-binding protein activator [Desulfuromonadales bacterium]
MKGIVIGFLALWVGLAGVPMALAVEEELSAIPVTVAAAPDLQAFEAGKTLLSLGQPEAALAALRTFLEDYPASDYVPQAHLLLARIFQNRGETDLVFLHLDRVPESAKGPEGRIVEGAALVSAGHLERGLALLTKGQPASLSPEVRMMRLNALAEAHALQGRHLEALVLMHRMGELDAAVLGRAQRAMREELRDDELAEAAFMFAGGPLGLEADYVLASRAFERGERQRAGLVLERLAQTKKDFPSRAEALNLLDRITGRPWLQRTIGAVLPLSGKFAPFGELVRKGMALAANIEEVGASEVNLVFRDGGGEAETAAAAVRTLAREDRVMAVAGPLSGVAAEAAAATAQSEAVPLMALSPRDGLAAIGSYVFRNSLTSRLQAEALAHYAVVEKGLHGFAVLYPENRLGREMAELFSAAVEARGGVVVKTQGFPTEGTDFRRSIKLLLNQDPDAPEEEAAEEGESVEEETSACATLDFEALFIPDYADRVGLLVPQLAYYEVENVQLLGINGWNSPELIRVAGDYVEKAVFVDGFFPYSPYPFVQDFVARYFEVYGEEPSILEAQGYDVATLLLSILSRPEIRTREDFRQALMQVVNYPGVTGATSFTPEGEAEKVLFLLQVQNGNIVQIN